MVCLYGVRYDYLGFMVKSMRILGVDPGKHKCGWAVFTNGGLECCGYDPAPMALDPLDLIIMELPQVYPGSRNEDPNDLIAITFAGAVFCARAEITWPKIKTVTPRQWKGTVQKEVMTDRIESKLSASEWGILEQCGVTKSKRHNVIDAIGIVLKEVGRL